METQAFNQGSFPQTGIIGKIPKIVVCLEVKNYDSSKRGIILMIYEIKPATKLLYAFSVYSSLSPLISIPTSRKNLVYSNPSSGAGIFFALNNEFKLNVILAINPAPVVFSHDEWDFGVGAANSRMGVRSIVQNGNDGVWIGGDFLSTSCSSCCTTKTNPAIARVLHTATTVVAHQKKSFIWKMLKLTCPTEDRTIDDLVSNIQQGLSINNEKTIIGLSVPRDGSFDETYTQLSPVSLIFIIQKLPDIDGTSKATFLKSCPLSSGVAVCGYSPVRVIAVTTSVGENLFRKYIGMTLKHTDKLDDNMIGLWFLESTTLAGLEKVGKSQQSIRMYQFPNKNAFLFGLLDPKQIQDHCQTKLSLCVQGQLQDTNLAATSTQWNAGKFHVWKFGGEVNALSPDPLYADFVDMQQINVYAGGAGGSGSTSGLDWPTMVYNVEKWYDHIHSPVNAAMMHVGLQIPSTSGNYVKPTLPHKFVLVMPYVETKWSCSPNCRSVINDNMYFFDSNLLYWNYPVVKQAAISCSSSIPACTGCLCSSFNSYWELTQKWGSTPMTKTSSLTIKRNLLDMTLTTNEGSMEPRFIVASNLTSSQHYSVFNQVDIFLSIQVGMTFGGSTCSDCPQVIQMQLSTSNTVFSQTPLLPHYGFLEPELLSGDAFGIMPLPFPNSVNVYSFYMRIFSQFTELGPTAPKPVEVGILSPFYAISSSQALFLLPKCEPDCLTGGTYLLQFQIYEDPSGSCFYPALSTYTKPSLTSSNFNFKMMNCPVVCSGSQIISFATGYSAGVQEVISMEDTQSVSILLSKYFQVSSDTLSTIHVVITSTNTAPTELVQSPTSSNLVLTINPNDKNKDFSFISDLIVLGCTSMKVDHRVEHVWGHNQPFSALVVKMNIKFDVYTCSNKGLTSAISTNIVLNQTTLSYDTVSDLVAVNTTHCPITSYALQDSTGGVLTAGVSISGTTVTVSPTMAHNTKFDLIGQQITGLTAKISFIFNDPPTTIAIPTSSFTDQITNLLTNSAPSFESDLESEITVEVTKFLNGSLSDSSQFLYQSPKTIDPENDTVYMSISGEDGITGLKVDEESDGSFFSLKLSRLGITSNETSTIKIILGDKKAFDKRKYSIEFKTIYSEEISADETIYSQALIETQVANLLNENQEIAESSSSDLDSLLDSSSADLTEADELVLQAINAAVESLSSENPTEELSAQEKEESYQEVQNLIDEFNNNQTLQNSGFERTGVLGFTFPGVNVEEIDFKMANKSTKLKTYPPKMVINPILSNGSFELEFDQNMVKPQSIMEPELYNKLFKIWLIPESERKLNLKGTFVGNSSSSSKRILQTADNRSLNLTVVEHSARKIKIDIGFPNKKDISRESIKDVLVVQVLQPFLLKSTENMLTLQYEGGFPEYERECPPQMEKETSENIQKATRRGGQIMKSASSTNFVISLLLQGSMQQLWGMIRTLQMIILIALIKNPQPAHTHTFLKGCMMFAQMDIFDGADIYEQIFKFQETTPLNDNFQQNGLWDKNLVMNSGSYFIFMLGIIAFNFMYVGMHFFSLTCACFRCCRKRGRKLGPKKTCQNVVYQNQKLFLESYLDIAICAVLNFMSFQMKEDNEGKGILAFLEKPDDIFCTVLTFIHLSLLVLFPLLGAVGIYRNFGSLNEEKFQKKYSIFLDENKTKTRKQALYTIFFLARRFWSVFALVYFRDEPILQCFILFWMSFINLCYMVGQNPLKQGNGIEKYNEFTIYICAYIFMLLLEISWPEPVKDFNGWLLIGFASLNILINMAITIFGSIINTRRDYVQRGFKKRAQELMLKRKDNTDFFLENFPEQSEHFKDERDLFKAIKFCKEWSKDRKWLAMNGRDPKMFKEEKMYFDIIQKFGLQEKAVSQKVQKTLRFLAVDNANEILQEMRAKKTSDVINQIVEKEKAREVLEDMMKNQKRQLNLNVLGIDLNQSISSFKNRKKISSKKEPQNLQSSLQKVYEAAEEEDSENSLEDRTPVYMSELQKLNEDPKLRGLSQIKSLMQTNQIEKMQTLKGLHDIQQNLEEGKKKEKFENALQDEILSYGGPGVETEVHQIVQKKQNKLLDLSFLFDSKINISAQEMRHEIQTSTGIMNQYQKNGAIVRLINGGENGYMQATIQSLIALDFIAEFFLTEKYTQVKTSNEQTICKLLNQVYTDYYQDHLKLIQALRPPVDLNMLNQFFLDKGASENEDAGSFLDFLIKAVSSETNMDPKNERMDPTSFINQAFLAELANTLVCSNGHMIEAELTGVDHIDLKDSPSFELGMIKMFKVKPRKMVCKTCGSKRVQNQTYITKTPKFLIFTFNVFKNSNKVISQPGRSLPEFFAASNYQQSYFGTKSNKVYQVCSVINVKGKKQKKCDFVCLTQRKEDSEIRWCAFSKDKVRKTTKEMVLNKTNPQVAIYQLID